MRSCLRQRYDVQPGTDTPELLALSAQGRSVQLRRNRGGQGVLLIDAAGAEFASALQAALDAVSKAAP